jgi:carbonic anhydrase
VRKFIVGIFDFRQQMLLQCVRRFEELVSAQAPDALFVTCSDTGKKLSSAKPKGLIRSLGGDAVVVKMN